MWHQELDIRGEAISKDTDDALACFRRPARAVDKDVNAAGVLVDSFDQISESVNVPEIDLDRTQTGSIYELGRIDQQRPVTLLFDVFVDISSKRI